jgi:hypothetical protein
MGIHRERIIYLLRWIKTHIEGFSFFSYGESVGHIPSLPYTDTTEELEHFLFEKWREIIRDMSETYEESRKCLIESSPISLDIWIEFPWLHGIDILIELGRKCESTVECSLHIIYLHVPDILREIVIPLSCNIWCFIGPDFPSFELQSECERAIEKIPEIIREFGIVLEESFFLVEVTIFSDRKCSKKIQHHHISTILLTVCDRVDDISYGFRHFLTIDREVSRHEKLLR